jgi:hypothetical protein
MIKKKTVKKQTVSWSRSAMKIISANPDLEVRSRRRVNNAAMLPYARPDLQIWICHSKLKFILQTKQS